MNRSSGKRYVGLPCFLMSTRCVKDASYCALAVLKSPRKEIEFMYARDYVSKNLLKLAVTITLAVLLPVLSYASGPAQRPIGPSFRPRNLANRAVWPRHGV